MRAGRVLRTVVQLGAGFCASRPGSEDCGEMVYEKEPRAEFLVYVLLCRDSFLLKSIFMVDVVCGQTYEKMRKF